MSVPATKNKRIRGQRQGGKDETDNIPADGQLVDDARSDQAATSASTKNKGTRKITSVKNLEVSISRLFAFGEGGTERQGN